MLVSWGQYTSQTNKHISKGTHTEYIKYTIDWSPSKIILLVGQRKSKQDRRCFYNLALSKIILNFRYTAIT